jgi:CRP-like cAMP-binding protein
MKHGYTHIQHTPPQYAIQCSGEGSLLTANVRRANAIAMGDVEILSMHREKFLEAFGGQMNQLHLDFAKRSSVLNIESKLLDFGDLEKIKVLGKCCTTPHAFTE